MSPVERCNVLLVDDRPDGLITLEAVLGNKEYNLVTATSGIEALAQLETADFAVILLDVQMPDMDGFQTAAKIKEVPRAVHTPIIFVTAINKDPFYIYQGYTVGAVDYIFKPFDPKILQSKVAVFASLFRQQNVIRKQSEDIQRKENELFQARKMEAVGRLAGGVAHDVNNLTTAIQCISQELLESFEDKDPRCADIREILKATERAFSLTKQLLTFSRRRMIFPIIIDVKAAIVEMNKLLHRLLGKDIDIQLELGVLKCVIKLDPGQLEQIIMNLAINGRDAMPGGGILTIRTSVVTLRREDFHLNRNNTPGSFVKIAVADNGTGMDQETLGHIFEPFFTTKEMDKGTGLGLSTVYGIVEQARGDIHVVSEVNKGSSFEIYLPAFTENAGPSTSRPVDSLQKTNKEIILVIEDEGIIRRVIVGRLTKLGYTALEASSGREAIDLAKSRPDISLILSDVMMPRMNGRQAVEAIQAIHPSLKALYMSGYPSNVIAADGMLGKGVAFIEKAALGSDLPRRIRELLDAP